MAKKYRVQVVNWGPYHNGPREALLLPEDEMNDTYLEALDVVLSTMDMVEREKEEGDEPVKLEIIEEEIDEEE